jgi:uncharacterized protein YbcI
METINKSECAYRITSNSDQRLSSYRTETIDQSKSSSLIKYARISLCHNPKRDTPKIIKCAYRITLKLDQRFSSYRTKTIDQSESSSLIKYARISLCNNPKRDTSEISVHTELHQNWTNGYRVIELSHENHRSIRVHQPR